MLYDVCNKNGKNIRASNSPWYLKYETLATSVSNDVRKNNNSSIAKYLRFQEAESGEIYETDKYCSKNQN